MTRQSKDLLFMEMALRAARQAELQGDVPIGAVIVNDSGLIATGFNEKEFGRCALHHAEILAIQRASLALGRWRLTDCTLYVTLEPCAMCAGAIVNARLQRVVYGCSDPKAGAVESLYQILQDQRLNHRPKVLSGPLSEPCRQILKAFFERRRSERATDKSGLPIATTEPSSPQQS
jgi:tRNA(adenine34) deaminase